MPSFRFPLEPVLRQRRAVEDEAQNQLAKILRQRMILLNQVRRDRDTITVSKQDLAGALVGTVDMTAVGQFASYSGQVTRRAHEVIARLAVIEDQVKEARKTLANAIRSRRVLEIVRQRRMDDWKRDRRRRETARQDEISAQRHRMLADGRSGVVQDEADAAISTPVR